MRSLTTDDLLVAFHDAQRELAAAMEREGETAKEAASMAREIVRPPRVRRKEAGKRVSSRLKSLGLETIPSEFMQLASVLSLGGSTVWDLDFPVAAGTASGGDAYLELVVEESEMLREDHGLEAAVAVGSLGEDSLVYVRKGVGHVLVSVEHEEGILSEPIASSLVGLIFVSARLQEGFARLMSRPERDPEWRDQILASVSPCEDYMVETAWVLRCLATRTAPV